MWGRYVSSGEVMSQSKYIAKWKEDRRDEGGSTYILFYDRWRKIVQDLGGEEEEEESGFRDVWDE